MLLSSVPVSLQAYGPSGRMRSKPVCKKIGEQSDAQRCKAAESVQRLDGNRGERIVREYLGEASRGKIVDAKRLRSEEHTSELQSLMRISYAVFCLKKKKTQQ